MQHGLLARHQCRKTSILAAASGDMNARLTAGLIQLTARLIQFACKRLSDVSELATYLVYCHFSQQVSTHSARLCRKFNSALVKLCWRLLELEI